MNDFDDDGYSWFHQCTLDYHYYDIHEKEKMLQLLIEKTDFEDLVPGEQFIIANHDIENGVLVTKKDVLVYIRGSMPRSPNDIRHMQNRTYRIKNYTVENEADISNEV